MSKKRKRKIISWQNILVLFFILSFAGVGAGAGLFFSYAKDAPDFDPSRLKPSETSFVYDGDENVVAELHGEQNRIPVSIEEVPKDLINAFIAIEDQYFYTHKGINIKSIIGSLVTNYIMKDGYRGASTITQQLVKNAFLSPEQSWSRKAQEAWLAIQLERHYSKDQILEFYLNQSYFGHSAYGVEAGANVYFGKSVGDLTLPEAAMLAGITKGPEIYSPYVNFERAKERQEVILNTMAEVGSISDDDAETAKKAELPLVGLKNIKADYRAPYFTDYVVQETAAQLQKELGVSLDAAYNKIYTEGLKVYTTVDIKVQEAAEKVLANSENYPYSKEDEKGGIQPQAAAVIIDPHNGYIKAMVGGREHQKRLGFNRATQAFRQPGSTFKPIVVYAAALDMGYTPATVVDDAPVAYPSGGKQEWRPKNYTNDFKGLTAIRKAVANSVNVVAIKVLESVGVDRGIEYAQNLGIKSFVLTGSHNDRNLPTALGGITKGVTPLELISSFGAFSNGGIHVEPIAILRVEDNNGRVLIDNRPTEWAATSPQVAYVMTDMLRSVVTEGTGYRLANFPYPVAGKTGTTSDDVDVWWVGYTPYYAGVVWMGHDEPTTMKNVAGGYQPALMWKQIMEVAHEGLDKKAFEKPDGIVGPIDVCAVSGKLPGELCDKDPRGSMIRKEIFIKGTEPKETCDIHVEEVIDTTTGLLASSYCPFEFMESRVFIRRTIPYEAAPNGQKPLDAQYEAPTEVCDVHQFPVWQFPEPDEEETPWNEESWSDNPWEESEVSDPVYYNPGNDTNNNDNGTY